MHFSRKIIPIALLIAASVPGLADGYSNTYQDHVLDEAAARRALVSAPSLDLKEVWFATGIEDYFRSPSCVVGRGIYAYTKPLLTRTGLWRGKEWYYADDFKDTKDTKCNVSSLTLHYESDIASFVDPADMRSEEAFDGVVPGLFSVGPGIPDSEIMKIRDDIGQLHTCLENKGSCNYPVDTKWMGSKAYDYVPSIQPRYLTSMRRDKDIGCYELMFAEHVPFPGAIAVTLCYTGENISKVDMTDMVTE